MFGSPLSASGHVVSYSNMERVLRLSRHTGGEVALVGCGKPN